jgi:hypothetical protein
MTRFVDCFMDKSDSDTGLLKSNIKSLADSVADITSTLAIFANELRCRLDTFESKCVQGLEAQNQAYLRHIKDLEKGHEKKNDELDTLRSELVIMQATLYELMMDNRELHQEHEMMPSLSVLEKKVQSGSESEQCSVSAHSSETNPIRSQSDLLCTGENFVQPEVVEQSISYEPVQEIMSSSSVHDGARPESSATNRKSTQPSPLFSRNSYGKIDILIAGASNTNYIRPSLLNRSLDSCMFTKLYCGNIAAAEHRLVALSDSPDIFVLNVGTNDLRSQQESVSSIVNRYLVMIRAVLDRHAFANVMVCTAPLRIDSKYYYFRTNKFNSDLCAALASFDRVALCDNSNLDEDRLYRKDGIHLLKSSGVRHLVRNILEALRHKLYPPTRPHKLGISDNQYGSSGKFGNTELDVKKQRLVYNAAKPLPYRDSTQYSRQPRVPINYESISGVQSQFNFKPHEQTLPSYMQHHPQLIRSPPGFTDFLQHEQSVHSFVPPHCPQLILPPQGFTMPPPGFGITRSHFDRAPGGF